MSDITKLSGLALFTEHNDRNTPLFMVDPSGRQFTGVDVEMIGGMIIAKLSYEQYPTADETVAALNKELVESAPAK
jgi:hypothetical protein